MPRPISARISVPALAHNLAVVTNQLRVFSKQNRLAAPKVWAVIKANAYGHGLDQALAGFASADGLAMLDLSEAIACRESGWEKPILLLEGYFEPSDLRTVADYRLSVVVHSHEQLRMLAVSPPSKPLSAFIKLNTGMNRLGFSPDGFTHAYRQALDAHQRGWLQLPGKMTHFARADDDAKLTEAQLALFQRITANLPGPVSVCNSAATLTPAVWLAAGSSLEQWVRPGICLYGSSPFPQRSAHELGLKPVMTLEAALIAVHQLPKGAGIGYGHRFVAEQAMRVGVVACGYADGYPRHAPDGTPVHIEGVRTRLLGRISMDMLVVDLGPVPQAGVGSRVVLWGENGPSVDEVARLSDTIAYELLCAVSPRVPRTVQALPAHSSEDLP